MILKSIVALLSHKVNLFDLHHKYADVLHIDEVLTPSRKACRETQDGLIQAFVPAVLDVYM